MKKRLFIALAGFIGVYHLVLGLGALLLPAGAFAHISNLILGMSPPEGSLFRLMTVFSAAYVLSFGVMMMLLAIHPEKYRALLLPAITLLGVRLINKLLLFATIGEQLHISAQRNIFAVSCLAVLLTGLVVLAPKKAD